MTSTKPLVKGDYAPSGPDDRRGPCPMINTLANHGYLPRDGRNVRVEDFTSALANVGVAPTLAAVFANPIFQEHIAEKTKTDPEPTPEPTPGIVSRALGVVRDPWSAFAGFGMRRPGQVDDQGRPVLDLDQLRLHNVVEHDASLTRGDIQSGDNWSLHPDLLEDLIASSSDGGKSLTADDLVALRKRRIARQREINPDFVYGPQQHQAACGEITLILKIIGDGERAPCEQVRAFFAEERLPVAEGWQSRQWWKLGVLEFFNTSSHISKMIGKY